MPYVKGDLTPRQVAFFRRLEEGISTPEEILREIRIRPGTFAGWLQMGKFANRYQATVRQLRATASAIEAEIKLKRARRKLEIDAEPPALGVEPDGEGEDRQTPLERRLIELHGIEAAARMINTCET